jgi:hypothetical protein
MDKKTFIITAVVLTILTCCKQTDNASKWVGNYIPGAGGVYTNSFYRVIVKEKDKNILSLEADTSTPPSSAPYVTYLVLQNVTLQTATTASFNESDSVTGNSHPFQLSGTVTLSGSRITLQGTGVNSSDTIHFYFYGAL